MSATNIFGLPIVASEISVSGPATFAENPTTSTGAPVAQLNEVVVVSFDTVSPATLFTVPTGETWLVEMAAVVVPDGSEWTDPAATLDVGVDATIFLVSANGLLAAAAVGTVAPGPYAVGFEGDSRGALLWNGVANGSCVLVAGDEITATSTPGTSTAGFAYVFIQGRKFVSISLA